MLMTVLRGSIQASIAKWSRRRHLRWMSRSSRFTRDEVFDKRYQRFHDYLRFIHDCNLQAESA
jgi:hypothetical protein